MPMRVSIDQAGVDEHARGIDRRGIARGGHATRPHLGEGVPAHEQIGLDGHPPGSVDHPSSANHHRSHELGSLAAPGSDPGVMHVMVLGE